MILIWEKSALEAASADIKIKSLIIFYILLFMFKFLIFKKLNFVIPIKTFLVFSTIKNCKNIKLLWKESALKCASANIKIEFIKFFYTLL